MKKKTVANQKANDNAVSVCPLGEVFALPGRQDYDKEFKRLQKSVKEQRLKGREIVVVMGVGFVGAVMAAVVADSTDKDGRPTSGSSASSGAMPRFK